jgi:hypothetical protein
MSAPSIIVGHVKMDGERAQRYQDWSARFARCSIEELIAALNDDVGHNGWGTARADYLHALHCAFEASGYDCSDFISKENGSMSLKYRLGLDGRRIVQLK